MPGRAGAMALGFGDFAPGARVVVAGQPRAGATRPPPGGAVEVHHPKELLLALARAALDAAGAAVSEDNPHFMPIAAWETSLTVLHGASLDLVCPVPVASNTLFLDGEDLLALTEERMAGDPDGLRQRRLALMDRILSLTPAAAARAALPRGELPVAPAPVDALLAHADALVAPPEAGAPPRSVRWLACDFESGPYNFLGLRRDRTPGSSQVAVQIEAAARGGAPVLVAFATPGTLADLGPVLRAFRAAEQEGGRGTLFVFFFGSPEEFSAVLAARTQALFFGDNFRSARIRFLFAPFGAGEVLGALRHASGSIDSAYGGVLDALAGGIGLRHRLVLGPQGRFDEAGADGPSVAGGAHAIGWDALYDPATLVRRRQATMRAAERSLVDAIAAIR